MNHLHPVFALALFVEAFLVLYLAKKWIKINLIADHSPTIDGLRGFLAFGVFVHHAAIWYAFLKTGQWVVPESRLFTHLGQSTVTLFFMITGFLFYGKILESRHKRASVDWLRLYVSRCLRILPLYFLVMLAGIFVIALIRYSGWVQPMQAPWDEKSLSGLFTAGVTWTLGYEWKFYYALPLLALMVVRVPWQWLAFALSMLFLSGASKALDIHAVAFVGGVAAAWLGKLGQWKKLAASTGGSVLALVTLLSAVAGFDTAYAWMPFGLLALSFALMANGAELWGVLSADLPRIFGEMTYSIYLLHGPLLFVAYRFVLGFECVVQLDPLKYWGTVALLTPLLLGVSACSFKFLELPCMSKTPQYTAWLRGLKISKDVA